MKLTKHVYSKIMAEAIEPYRIKIKSELSKVQKLLETDMEFYFDKQGLKIYKTVPVGYMPQVETVFIKNSLVPKMTEIVKKDIRFSGISAINKSYRDDGLEINLNKKIEIPFSQQKDCGCRKFHAVVIKDCKEILAPIVDLVIQLDDLIKIINHAESSFRTVKQLEQGLIGIEKIAPNAIAEIKSSVSSGAMIIATDVSKFKL